MNLDPKSTTVSVDRFTDGTYGVGIHYGHDISIGLDTFAAATYTKAVHKVAALAEYAAAVIDQFTTLGIPDGNALPTVGELMDADWDGIAAYVGLKVVPLVAASDRTPQVRFDVNHRPFTQVTAADARDHAAAVHRAAATARLDERYYKFLRGPLNLPDDKARGLIGELADHRIDGGDRVIRAARDAKATLASGGVLTEIAAEQDAQHKKFGEQNHPDLDPHDFPSVARNEYAFRADRWKQINTRRAKDGCEVKNRDPEVASCTAWDGILLEEVYEALAEKDPEAQRAELVQVAAVAATWVEAIDRRSGAGNGGDRG
ncbi:hypothetical protein [Glycomyces artemisiae]|uniref:Uncharacterized protein n=1 Tax=Glycomyces artemisiae TaxID=1076443 RepID=A0A2T0UEW1_9ACTN|nr:hypothetical protein [Glycomyces artemisiae]PRY56469.1 hypothetical protein B0I28_109118 [Glycomyces artemisiae]